MVEELVVSMSIVPVFVDALDTLWGKGKKRLELAMAHYCMQLLICWGCAKEYDPRCMDEEV
jgi:hypothetical protein